MDPDVAVVPVALEDEFVVGVVEDAMPPGRPVLVAELRATAGEK